MKKPPYESEHESSTELDEILHQELSSLRDQEAPVDLADDVFRSLAQQASRPWWRQSLNRWPQGPRLLALTCLALSAMGFLGGVLTLDIWPAWAVLQVPGLDSLSTAWPELGIVDRLTRLPRDIGAFWNDLSPTLLWIFWGGLAFTGCMVAGLGTFLVRLLSLQNRSC